MRIAPVVLLTCLTLNGCSRPDAPTAPPATEEPNAVQIDPITAVLPNLPTHLCVSDSLTAFVQETDNGLDTVYEISPLDMACASQLTSAAVAAAMGKPDAHGNLQDLAADGDTIYFYFVGNYKRAFVSCLGRLNPSGKVEILADQGRLGTLCGIGDAISIYHGQLAQSGGKVWLWLHSEDGSYFLQVDPKSTDPATLISRPFDHPVADLAAPSFTRESYALSPGPAGGLLLLDYWNGILWQITPTGYAKSLHSFTGLPNNASPPAIDATGRIIVFFSGTDLFVPREDSQMPEPIPYAEYPALIVFGDKQQYLIFQRSELLSGGQFPAENLKFNILCSTANNTAWLAYDPGSGEIFRLRLVNR
jgi:hypothetical protein